MNTHRRFVTSVQKTALTRRVSAVKPLYLLTDDQIPGGSCPIAAAFPGTSPIMTAISGKRPALFLKEPDDRICGCLRAAECAHILAEFLRLIAVGGILKEPDNRFFE